MRLKYAEAELTAGDGQANADVSLNIQLLITDVAIITDSQADSPTFVQRRSHSWQALVTVRLRQRTACEKLTPFGCRYVETALLIHPIFANFATKMPRKSRRTTCAVVRKAKVTLLDLPHHVLVNIFVHQSGDDSHLSKTLHCLQSLKFRLKWAIWPLRLCPRLLKGMRCCNLYRHSVS